MPNRPLSHVPKSQAAITTIANRLAELQAEGLCRIDAQLLLLHAINQANAGRAWLIVHGDDVLPPEAAKALDALCARRFAGEPVAYLTGRKPFYGLELQVDARVLDPRPDTETLVDWALERLVGRVTPRVLDLGTGSGAIALALAHAAPQSDVLAVDQSKDALLVAQANAERLNLPVHFLESDWFSNVEGVFDLIVSNPPYIAEGDPHLPGLQHEPLIALVGGVDGLRDLRTIASGAPAHLAAGAWLLLEHGWDQANAVQVLLRAQGFDAVQTRNDLAGTGRCTGGRWPGVK